MVVLDSEVCMPLFQT